MVISRNCVDCTYFAPHRSHNMGIHTCWLYTHNSGYIVINQPRCCTSNAHRNNLGQDITKKNSGAHAIIEMFSTAADNIIGTAERLMNEELFELQPASN